MPKHTTNELSSRRQLNKYLTIVSCFHLLKWPLLDYTTLVVYPVSHIPQSSSILIISDLSHACIRDYELSLLLWEFGAAHPCNYASITFGEFSMRAQNSKRVYSSCTYALGKFQLSGTQSSISWWLRDRYRSRRARQWEKTIGETRYQLFKWSKFRSG